MAASKIKQSPWGAPLCKRDDGRAAGAEVGSRDQSRRVENLGTCFQSWDSFLLLPTVGILVPRVASCASRVLPGGRLYFVLPCGVMMP